MKKFNIATETGTIQVECEEFYFKGMPFLLHRNIDAKWLWVVTDKITGVSVSNDESKTEVRSIAKGKIKKYGLELYLRMIIKQCNGITLN